MLATQISAVPFNSLKIKVSSTSLKLSGFSKIVMHAKHPTLFVDAQLTQPIMEALTTYPTNHQYI